METYKNLEKYEDEVEYTDEEGADVVEEAPETTEE